MVGAMLHSVSGLLLAYFGLGASLHIFVHRQLFRWLKELF